MKLVMVAFQRDYCKVTNESRHSENIHFCPPWAHM